MPLMHFWMDGYGRVEEKDGEEALQTCRIDTNEVCY